MEHAIHNCTFQFGLRFTLDVQRQPGNQFGNIIQQPNPNNQFANNGNPGFQQQIQNQNVPCQKTEETGIEDSLFININCQNVVGLMNCNPPNQPDSNPCIISCNPSSVQGRGTEIGSQESLNVNWNFGLPGVRPTQYMVRFAEVRLSPQNTILNEFNSQQRTIPGGHTSMQITPPGGRSLNYTFQICAMRTPSCSTRVNWNSKPRFALEFRTKADRRKDEAPVDGDSAFSIVRPLYRSGTRHKLTTGLLLTAVVLSVFGYT